MDVYTLVGKSGTGKSYHAMEICEKMNIESIVDDGLFIYHGTIIAGKSAKRAATKLGSIKTALFTEEEHRRVVANAIAEKNPETILVLATSEEMADKICESLEIPAPPRDSVRRIRIEMITSERERNLARVERDVYGKHIIPAPALQLKKNFAGYFIDPLGFLRGGRSQSERTIVRPQFSYSGDYFIAQNAIENIVTIVGKRTEGVARVILITPISDSPENYSMDVALKIKSGYGAIAVSREFQKRVKEEVEKMTAFAVERIDVEVRGYV